ncbi:MAG TPA: extracellular solute-binding protein [Nitrospiria bacterium]|nr:extracellular solute-binding protein [Nitrospiria bacterium]
MRKTMSLFISVVILLSLSPAWAGDPELSGEITVLQASSLTELFKRAKTKFEEQNPGVKVLIETGASMTLIRKVSDLQKEADVIAVADSSLIPKFLVPQYVEESTDFMTEQIALIVGDDAKFADSINGANWPEILLKDGVEYGVSNPDIAPVGYRSMMVWKLAEKHYQSPGLYEKLRKNLPRRNIRPNAVALLTLLKSGELDYVFDYGSLGRQHGLRVITLPPQINLSDPAWDKMYSTVSVEIPGKKPGETREIKGSPIVYGIAPLKAAPNKPAARAFVDFLLGSGGQTIMADLGLTPLEIASTR